MARRRIWRASPSIAVAQRVLAPWAAHTFSPLAIASVITCTTATGEQMHVSARGAKK
jgi:hypothetical protein